MYRLWIVEDDMGIAEAIKTGICRSGMRRIFAM